MIERCHDDGTTRSRALYSPCEGYRYLLERRWSDGPRLLWIMLNPSTATELANDPTIERCERRSRALGAGTMTICNLFAWRATDPRDLRRAERAEGAANRETLLSAAGAADQVIAAWGVHGAHRGAGPQVAVALRQAGHPLWHLGLTKAGHPRHPLYVAYATGPTRWEDA